MRSIKDIKKSWSEVTVDQYIELMNAASAYEKPIEAHIAMIALMLDTDIDTVKSLPLATIEKIDIAWIYKPQQDFGVDTEIVAQNGLTYCIAANPMNMTFGQWIDYDQVSRVDALNTFEKIPYILSFILIEKGKEYGKESLNASQKIELMRNLSMDKAMGIINFFLLASLHSKIHLANYSETIVRQITQMMVEMGLKMASAYKYLTLEKLKTLRDKGGIIYFINYRKVILLKQILSQISQSEKYLDGLQSEYSKESIKSQESL